MYQHVKMYFIGCIYIYNACCRPVYRLVYIIPQPRHLDRFSSNVAQNSNDDRAWLTGNGAILRLDGGQEANHTLFVTALTKMRCPEHY